MSADLSRSQGERNLSVVGLGYIGLPTAIVLANAGWHVTGVDVSPRTVEMVNRGELPFVEDGLADALQAAIATGGLKAQEITPPSDIYIVTVPTPFKENHEADLRFIDAAADGIAPVLSGGELVILESTSPPGATALMAQRILAARPDLSLDGDGDRPIVYFAYAPERVLPGRILKELVSNDRVIGGLNPGAAKRAQRVYATFCAGELCLTNAVTAEMTKLTENAYRDVSIAFANELSLVADKIGVDVWELIELANRHPRVNILSPGPGVGGHCIAVDPWFIVSTAPEESRLIRTAREVNDGKPEWVLGKVDDALTEAPAQPTIALLGLSFKPNIDDLRESPALEVATRLVADKPGAQFLVVEPNIGALPPALAGRPNVTLASAADALECADVVVLLVDHDEFAGLTPRVSGTRLIDTRGLWRA